MRREDPAERAAADDLGVRAAVLLQLPVRRGAQSFLGLGIQPPLADWGGMVRENAAAIGFGGLGPALAGGGDRPHDHRRQPGRRLDPVASSASVGRLGGDVRRRCSSSCEALRIEPAGVDRRVNGLVLVDNVVARAEARRGARPDRRIRRRQIHDRPRRDGYIRAPAARSPAARSRSTASGHPRSLARGTPRACAAQRIAYIAQSAAASFNPAMTDHASRSRDAGRLHGADDEGRGAGRRAASCSDARPAQSRKPSANAIRTRSPAASCSAP